MDELSICPACQAAAQNEIGILRRPELLFGPAGVVPWVRRRSVVFRWAFRYLRMYGPVFVLRKTIALVAAAVRAKVVRPESHSWKTPARTTKP